MMAFTKSAQVNHWTRAWETYTLAEKCALLFPSRDEGLKAIRLCWNDSELGGVPYRIANNRKMFVPLEAVKLFRSKGVQFEVAEAPQRKWIRDVDLCSRKELLLIALSEEEERRMIDFKWDDADFRGMKVLSAAGPQCVFKVTPEGTELLRQEGFVFEEIGWCEDE